jgi:hypothetical protein
VIPFDISGTVRIPTAVRSNSATVKAVANRLAAMLDEKDVRPTFYVEGNRVRFHNKWFGGTIRFGVGSDIDDIGSSFFSIFGSGTFDIEAAVDGITARFSLSLARMWVSLALFAAFFCVVTGRFAGLTWDALWPFPLAFIAGFFVLNLAYMWVRVWFWLRRGLRDLPELQTR